MARIRVEVVYATPERQERVSVRLPDGATVADAIDRSGIGALFPDAALERRPVGVWGHPVARDHALADGDRVEIYRPLEADPRDARRRLAAHGKAMGQHDDDEGA